MPAYLRRPASLPRRRPARPAARPDDEPAGLDTTAAPTSADIPATGPRNDAGTGGWALEQTELCLVRLLLRGVIDADSYRRQMAGLAAAEETRRPLVLPPSG